MVDGGPRGLAQGHVPLGAGLGRGLEQGRVHDPHEGPLRPVDQAAAPGDLQAGGAQQGARGVHGAGGEEDAVAGPGADGPADPARWFLDEAGVAMSPGRAFGTGFDAWPCT